MKAFLVQMIDLDLFFRYLKGRCHGNRFCEKMANSILSSLWHSETEWDNAVYMHDLIVPLMPLVRSSVLSGVAVGCWQSFDVPSATASTEA